MRMYEGISTLQRVESKRLANAMQMPCSRPNSYKGQGLARARRVQCSGVGGYGFA